MTNSADKIYASPQSKVPFSFDEKVVAVFPDMIKRSVPGYSQVIDNIQQLAQHYISQGSNCYDLGCSLGAASLAMSYGNQQSGVTIIGVDNSSAMIERCRSNIEGFKHKTPIELQQKDIQQVTISNASMVVLNYTLQFIPQQSRYSVLQNIYNGMLSNSILILSEKIIFEDEELNQLMITLHHQFKRDNGYSDLEISQKRNALETVLVPESLQQHSERLEQIGFDQVVCFLQHLNFVSLIAIKK